MSILLVTGRKAAETAERTAEELEEKIGEEVEVETLDLDLAAFMTPASIEGLDLSGHRLVLVPGLARGDYSRYGGVFKGTKSLHRLRLLEPEDLNELSPELPADRLIERAAPDLEEGEPALHVGDLPVGGDTRVKVMGEIVDATEISEERLLSRATYYLRQGADIVDAGVPIDADPADVEETTEALSRIGAPVSVDTMQPELIEAGLPFVDLVLSCDEKVLEESGEVIAENGTPAVVVPGRAGLEENLETAERLGIPALPDPVLDPAMEDLSASIQRFRETDGPLFFGAGNVTELMDADSVGVNALLAALAQETGSAVVFTPEHSPKARGSIRELAVATRMARVAELEDSPMKDLGLDLLYLKEKTGGDEPVEELGERIRATRKDYERDPRGHFRIGLDREEGEILAVFHPGEADEAPVTVAGEEAAAVSNEIAERGLVSLHSHSAYLGRELQKAEEALLTGKSYRQDSPLFEEKMPYLEGGERGERGYPEE